MLLPVPITVHHAALPPIAVPRGLYQLRRTYSFPGNVRELETPLVFNALARHHGMTLSLASFREALSGGAELPAVAVEPVPGTTAASTCGTFLDRLPTLREAEEQLIMDALAAGGRQPGGSRPAC